IGQAQYGITDIESYFMPNIRLQYNENSGGPESVHVYLSSTGWPVSITEIKVLEGDVNITNPLPAYLKQYKYNGMGTPFVITGTRKNGQDFKLSLSLTDTLNRVQRYELDAIGNKLVLNRLK
ncbi:MAG TPA: hypothetical protein VHC47_12585, partial [Mucilaginibacter sp.]|nr:hypothetical protein [Mucilaginibacter sp.]